MYKSINRREYIYTLWDLAKDEDQRAIFREFKMRFKGFYTEKGFLDFLEKKLRVEFQDGPASSEQSAGLPSSYS